MEGALKIQNWKMQDRKISCM